MPKGDRRKYTTYHIPVELDEKMMELKEDTGWNMKKAEFFRYIINEGIKVHSDGQTTSIHAE